MSYNSLSRTPLAAAKVIRSAYSSKLSLGITFPENSPFTRQEFKDESDINTIMAQYMRTGELPSLNEVAPQYLDLSESMSFQEQMLFVSEAQSLFSELPSEIRNRFQNDPGAFIDFCGDENNRPELAKMGLLNTEATKAILSPEPPLKQAPMASTEASTPKAKTEG